MEKAAERCACKMAAQFCGDSGLRGSPMKPIGRTEELLTEVVACGARLFIDGRSRATRQVRPRWRGLGVVPRPRFSFRGRGSRAARSGPRPGRGSRCGGNTARRRGGEKEARASECNGGKGSYEGHARATARTSLPTSSDARRPSPNRRSDRKRGGGRDSARVVP